VNTANLQQRKKKDGVYYESHHIIPRCMGGTEEVLLTGKEHFICHLLLCRMAEGTEKHKMINALIMMSFAKSKGQERYTAKSYSLVRKLIAEKNSEMFKGRKKSEETKRNMKGRSGVWERNDAYRQSCSERQKGNVLAWTLLPDDDPKKIKIIKKISNKMLGENNPMSNENSKNKMKSTMRKKRWWTNGKEDLFTENCPPGFVNGRTKNRKVKKNASTQK
jgi:hypothetical protein